MKDKEIQANFDFILKNKESLLKEYRDKYVLVHGEKVVGSFDTYERAAGEGVRLFGTEAGFVVYEMIEKEPVNLLMEAIL